MATLGKEFERMARAAARQGIAVEKIACTKSEPLNERIRAAYEAEVEKQARRKREVNGE